MKRSSFGAVAVTAIALVAAVSPANAQLVGIPYGPVETGLGISLAADYGKPEGGGSAYGATGGIGFSRFGLSASGGVFDAGGAIGNATSFGGRLGMKLFGGGLNPVTVGVQLGASSTADIGTSGNSQTLILPAAWVKLSPPLFPLKPYGQVYYLTGSNLAPGAKEARFTIGANLNLLLGFGFHGAYDWGDSGYVWGVGAHFTFRVPGMPGVPGM